MDPFGMAQHWVAASLRVSAAITRMQQVWLAQFLPPWQRGALPLALNAEQPAPRPRGQTRGRRGRA